MIALTEQISGTDKMKQLEQLATEYSFKQRALGEIITDMDREVSQVRVKYLKQIRAAVAKAREAKSALHTALTAAPECFTKPRTREFSGIKIGFRKGTGGIDWDDDAKVCALIEKHFPKAQAELLIKTTKKPISKALADLDVADLKRIGCRVEDTGDVVVISSTDSEVDKLVKALLADQPESEVAA